MTAATKSHAVVNLAMEVTRAKGTVVIVGDVGLNVDRAVFYRKEIDLLMSTSYGPGRYDAPLRSRRARLSVRLRALDAQPQHAGVPRARRGGHR